MLEAVMGMILCLEPVSTRDSVPDWEGGDGTGYIPAVTCIHAHEDSFSPHLHQQAQIG